jgi:hypothetical protein
MTDQSKTATRDQVLFAFHRECTTPTAEQIIEWTDRYPEFAEDIREHAAICLDWAAEESSEDDEIDEVLMSRAQSRALNAIFNAQVAESHFGDEVTFDLLMSERGLNTPQLSRTLDVARDVLSALFRGQMLAPLGNRLEEALTQCFQVTGDIIRRAHQHALSNPSMGHAKARGQPSIVQHSYEEIIRSSNMSDTRKAYWLNRD